MPCGFTAIVAWMSGCSTCLIATALLADAGLYSRDAQAYEQASVSLRTAEQRLDAAEEEWLKLEMLREGLESA